VSHDLKEEQFFIPSMLIQPIVENAFKHAFTEKDKVYNLEISFKNTLNTDYIKCSIKDNGVGRVQAQKVKQSSHHLSVSSRNLDERIKIIQKQLKKEASITIIDLKDDEGNPKGTEVMLVLPKIHKTANFNSATLIKKG
jgi:sensor histidine kinase YesM